jgi:hypothetical protein
VAETVILNGHHIGYQFANKSMGERLFQRKVYDKEKRPYCHFQRRKVYMRSVAGSSYLFETTRDQDERG